MPRGPADQSHRACRGPASGRGQQAARLERGQRRLSDQLGEMKGRAGRSHALGEWEGAEAPTGCTLPRAWLAGVVWRVRDCC